MNEKKNVYFTGVTNSKHIMDSMHTKRDSDFRVLLDDAPSLAFILVSRDGSVLFWNTGAEYIFGVQVENAIHQINFLDLFKKGSHQADFVLKNAIEAVTAQNAPMRIEIQRKNDQGNDQWLELFLNPQSDQDGKPFGVFLIGVDITEKKQVVQTLQKNEKTLSTILSSSPITLLLVENRIIRWINAAGLKMFGAESSDQLIGKNTRILYRSQKEYESVGATIYNGMKKSRYVHADAYFVRLDKTPFIGEFTIAAPNPQNPVQGAIATIVDVTWRRKIERELRRSKEKYQSLVENINDVLFTLDLKGKVTFVSPAIERIYSKKIPDLLNKSINNFLSPTEHQRLNTLLRKALLGRCEPEEFRIRGNNGNSRFVRISLRPHIEDGRPVGVTGIMTDITDTIQAQLDLKRERDFTSAIVETAGAFVVAYDRHGRIVRFNRACEKRTGYYQTDIKGKLMWETLVPDGEIEQTKKVFRNNLREGLSEMFEGHWLTRNNEKILISWTHTALKNEYGDVEFVIATGIDITAQRELERKLITMSVEDDLTGLYNRRGFFTLAEKQLSMALDAKQSLTLLFIDLDGMKTINDTLGHQEGDRALNSLADILRKTCSANDTIARLGGDEFAILTIESKEDDASSLSNRIRAGIDQFNEEGKVPFTLSVSIGFSSCKPNEPCSIDELLAQADSLMYRQKRRK